MKTGLLRRQFHVKLERPNMEQYLNEILSLTQELAAIEVEKQHEFIGVIMLNRLGDKYDPMIMVMESSAQRSRVIM
jgi:hypothetical protein